MVAGFEVNYLIVLRFGGRSPEDALLSELFQVYLNGILEFLAAEHEALQAHRMVSRQDNSARRVTNESQFKLVDH